MWIAWLVAINQSTQAHEISFLITAFEKIAIHGNGCCSEIWRQSWNGTPLFPVIGGCPELSDENSCIGRICYQWRTMELWNMEILSLKMHWMDAKKQGKEKPYSAEDGSFDRSFHPTGTKWYYLLKIFRNHRIIWPSDSMKIQQGWEVFRGRFHPIQGSDLNW